ncbi:hypothetical protein COP2_033632 [Malus domestica]
MTLAAHWPRAAARAAAGGGRPPRLAGKSNYFQKLPKFADLKISMSRATFIPVAKAHLAWKHFNFTKTVKNPRIRCFQFDLQINSTVQINAWLCSRS